MAKAKKPSPWGKKKPSPWGKKAKKPAASDLADLQRKLVKTKKTAPPPPKVTLYRWLTNVYRLRRNLSDVERKELLELAKKKGITSGDKRLRAVIEETGGTHVSSKMRWKYAVALEKALAEKVQSKNLRSFIEGHSGINRLAGGVKPTPTKPTLLKLSSPKPTSPKPIWLKPKGPKSRRRKRRGGPHPFG